MIDKVLFKKDGRIARITLNRPEVLNAIDDEVPALLSAAVARAEKDPEIHVIVLAGAGRGFSAGYELDFDRTENPLSYMPQEMPWDPMQDFRSMWANTQHFMSLWRAMKPVICKVHGFALAGGSDIALCCDITIMAESAQIGYMPARVWGCPTTAMWVYRIGAEKAKRILLTGDKIDGREAAAMGLVLKAVPDEGLDAEIEALAERMATVPINQLAMQKMVINQAIEGGGMMETQRLATIFDGMTRHSPEGLNFRARVEETGWRQAVRERDHGIFDWTTYRPIPSNE